MIKFYVLVGFQATALYFVLRGLLLFSCDEYLCTPRLFQLTPDNRFIVSLNDKPVKGHKRVLHKYSSHENSSEIDHEEQSKSRVQKKRTATETRPSFSPLI